MLALKRVHLNNEGMVGGMHPESQIFLLMGAWNGLGYHRRIYYLFNTSEYMQHCVNIVYVQSYHLSIFRVAALSKQIG